MRPFFARSTVGHQHKAGARALYRSAERLRTLPDHLEVLPGAFAGSVCGRGLSGKPSSTIERDTVLMPCRPGLKNALFARPVEMS